MSYAIQQSTTAFPLVFLLVQSSDHITGLTGASPTVTLSKSGAAFGSPSGAVTEIANGWYKVAGNATDSNTLGPLILHATAASADPTDMVFEVVSYNPQSTGFGLVNVSSNVVQWNGSNVSAPATAGIPDVNTKNINNVAAATPGASGGILISGSNSGTTTLGALTITGATTMTGGLAVSAGATITGSANGAGLTISGGGTSGAGLVINTTSGDGVQVSPTAGHGVNIAANGTSKHGITSTGGTAGTSDGIKGVAGTGGVDIRGNITGNVTGNLSGSVGSVTGAVGSVTAGVTVSTNNDKSNYVLTQTFPTNFSSLSIDGAGDVTYNNAAPPTTASIATAVFTTVLTESYAALHAVPTVAQALLEIRGHLCEKSVSGTTLTTKKVDGSTTAETFTLSDATSPTSITRAS